MLGELESVFFPLMASHSFLKEHLLHPLSSVNMIKVDSFKIPQVNSAGKCP